MQPSTKLPDGIDPKQVCPYDGLQHKKARVDRFSKTGEVIKTLTCVNGHLWQCVLVAAHLETEAIQQTTAQSLSDDCTNC